MERLKRRVRPVVARSARPWAAKIQRPAPRKSRKWKGRGRAEVRGDCGNGVVLLWPLRRLGLQGLDALPVRGGAAKGDQVFASSSRYRLEAVV